MVMVQILLLNTATNTGATDVSATKTFQALLLLMKVLITVVVPIMDQDQTMDQVTDQVVVQV